MEEIKTNWARSDRELRRQINILQAAAEVQAEQLASVAGISRSAFYARMQTPERFRIIELRRLDDFAQEHGMSIFGA